MGKDQYMIKVLVSDMDGTLCDKHGDTIFHLSSRNEDALNRLKENNIKFYTASGRMSSYGKKMLDDHGFTDIITSGFNGADIYDNGSYPSRYTLSIPLIKEIISYTKDANYLQLQTLDSTRIFSNLLIKEIERYKSQMEEFHIDEVLNTTIDAYLKNDPKDNIGKLSIIVMNKNKAYKLYQKLQELTKDTCFVTMSNDRIIEICNKNANKGVFIQYLQKTYHYTKDEIAVIGDALNDAEMYPYSSYTFAMNSGKEEVKKLARYTVEDVAECVDIILDINKKASL